MAEHDPFPRQRVTATIRRMPAYLKLSWRLARDPLLGRARRAAVMAAAGYLASPVDLVPGVIPVLGQLDDIAVALGALRFALAGLDPVRRHEHLSAVGLEDGHLGEDLRTIGAASAWTVRAGGRTGARAAKGGYRAAATGVRVAGQATSKAAPAAREAAARAVPAARSAAARAVPATRAAAAKAVPATREAASKAVPAAKGVAASAVPAAKSAASRAVPAAKGVAARGMAKVKGLAGRGPVTGQVTVHDAPLPAIGPGTTADDDAG